MMTRSAPCYQACDPRIVVEASSPAGYRCPSHPVCRRRYGGEPGPSPGAGNIGFRKDILCHRPSPSSTCRRNFPPCHHGAVPCHLLTLSTFSLAYGFNETLSLGILVPTVGFEPTASGLQNHCSTVELCRRIWRRGRICTSRQPVGHSVACYLHPLEIKTNDPAFVSGNLLRSDGRMRHQSLNQCCNGDKWPCHRHQPIL